MFNVIAYTRTIIAIAIITGVIAPKVEQPIIGIGIPIASNIRNVAAIEIGIVANASTQMPEGT